MFGFKKFRKKPKSSDSTIDSNEKLSNLEAEQSSPAPERGLTDELDTSSIPVNSHNEEAMPPAEAEGVVPSISASDFGREKPTLEAAEGSDEGAVKTGFFKRILKGLSKTRANLTNGLSQLLLGKKTIDDDLLEELETHLLMADVGVEATSTIIKNLTERVTRKQLADSGALYEALKDELQTILQPCEQEFTLNKAQDGPFVLLVVGVNGVGKTTTIGKMAKRFQSQGHSVMLAAGDTFRAAAVEQLQVWGQRNNVPVVAQATGADSASVIFDAIQSAQAKGVDVVIADTAGRLQNKTNLMAELEKVTRVMKKLDASAPHEVMLVLDAGTGQNALSQAKTFQSAVGVTGLSLTKLDGTAKGGVIFAIAKQAQLPVRFIGVGEQIDDLRPFEAAEFVNALFGDEAAES